MGPDARKKKNQKKKQKQKQKKASSQHGENPSVMGEDLSQDAAVEEKTSDKEDLLDPEEPQLEDQDSKKVDPTNQAEGSQESLGEPTGVILGEKKPVDNDIEAINAENANFPASPPGRVASPETDTLRKLSSNTTHTDDNSVNFDTETASNVAIDTTPHETLKQTEDALQNSFTNQRKQDQDDYGNNGVPEDQITDRSVIGTEGVQDLTTHIIPTQQAEIGQETTENFSGDSKIEAHQNESSVEEWEAGPNEVETDLNKTSDHEAEPLLHLGSSTAAIPDPALELGPETNIRENHVDTTEETLCDQHEREVETAGNASVTANLGASVHLDSFQTTAKEDVEITSKSEDRAVSTNVPAFAQQPSFQSSQNVLRADEIEASANESSLMPTTYLEESDTSIGQEDTVERANLAINTIGSIEHIQEPDVSPHGEHTIIPSQELNEQGISTVTQDSNGSGGVQDYGLEVHGNEQKGGGDIASFEARDSSSPHVQGSESHQVDKSNGFDDDLFPSTENSAVYGIESFQQEHPASDELFDSEAKEDGVTFSWEGGDDFLSHLGQSDSAHLSGTVETAEPLPYGETAEWLSHEQNNDIDLLPWEGANEEAGDSSVIRNSLSPGKIVKNFSFLDNDDDLLDDDDSFLDSDEELTANATTVGSDTQRSAVPVVNSYLPQYDNIVQSPMAGVQTSQLEDATGPSEILVAAHAQVPTPIEKKTTKYGPPMKTDADTVGSQVSSIPATPQIHPSVSSIRPALPEFGSTHNMNKKLDEEKKKSDAYDFPLDLTSRKPNKIRQPKPFGSVNSAVSLGDSSTASPRVSSVVLNSGTNILNGPPFPVNQNAVLSNQNQGRTVPPMRNPSGSLPSYPPQVGAVEQPNPYPQGTQNSSYQPPLSNKPSSTAPLPSSTRYAPSTTNAEPPRRANVVSPYAPQTDRARAFSSVSNGSAGSFGSSKGAGHIPPATQINRQSMSNGTAGGQHLRPEAQAPLVPALKTIGLPSIGNQALSPNTQKRSHARSNSSVYAPAYSSKYAPTVQPQFHLPSQDNTGTGYALNPNQGHSFGTNDPAHRPNIPSVAGRLTDSQPVDPNISFHRQFPLFSWGNSSKVVHALPEINAANAFFPTVGSGLKIQISNYDTIVKANSDFKSFPGPLIKNRTKIKEVQKWISDTCSTLSKEEPLKDLVLYKIMSAKLSQDSTLVDVAKALYNSDDLLPFLSQASSKKKNTFNAFKVNGNEQLRVLAALQTGDHEHALELALADGDYALALMIGSLVGKDKWAEVVEIYLHESFLPVANDAIDFSSSLLTLIFRVSIGNSKRIFSELASDHHKANWALVNWKVIVAAVLSNVSNHSVRPLPDASQLPPATTEFLIEFGLFLYRGGTHLGSMACFLAADLPLLDRELVPGSDFKFYSLGTANSWEGMLLSEVYEYYLTIRDPSYPGSCHSLLQKLSHSLALIECGMAAEASKYVDAVTQSMKPLRKNNTLAYAVEIRLNFVSSRLIDANVGWLGKPKLSQVWGQLDKSFNKFIGGDTEEPPNEESIKIFENFTPSSSRNASLLDLSKEPLSFKPAESVNGTMTPAFTPLQRPQMHTNVSSSSLMKGRKSSSVAESKYDPCHNQWSATPIQNTVTESSISAFESPVQPFHYKSPSRSKDQLMAAGTPPPLFSSASSKKYAARRANLGGGGALDDVPAKMETENALQSHGQTKPIRGQRSERPVNAALLADLQALPPPISGVISGYSGRRGSVQSRTSIQSNSSDVPLSKHVPVLATSALAGQATPAENFGVSPSAIPNQTTFPEPSQGEFIGVDNGDGDDLTSRSGETLKPEDRKNQVSPEPFKREVGSAFSEIETDASITEDQEAKRVYSQTLAKNDDEQNLHFKQVESTRQTTSPRVESMNLSKDHETFQATPWVSGPLKTGPSRAKKAYAPPQEGRNRTVHNPYSPSNSQPALYDGATPDAVNNMEHGGSNEQIDMFSYGGYNVTSAVSTEIGEEQVTLTKESEFSSSRGTDDEQSRDNSISRLLEPAGTERDAGPQTRSELPQTKKLSLMADDGDELFSSDKAPVIRPSSNPSFKPFTPASTPGAEEYYEDIIENESDDEEDEAEAEKQRLEAEKQQAEAEMREAKEQAKKKSSVAKGDKDKNPNNASWFGWLRKDANEKKPVKAKLGHQNTFYYDDKLQRWVNKNATAEEKQQVSAPPPPPPIIKKKEEGSPKVKPRSGSVAGGAAARTGAFVPPTYSFKEPVASSTENAGASRSVSPSLSPSVSLSGKKANNIDDLMSLANTPGNQGGTRRKKKAARGYVNVMNNM
ncbi:COPII coat assembly protein SEC16 LALA0_S04e03026g [Lachancea lanzarotensis]|uniref:Protein transport protein sec16 n=1 Tax=Lachancea lanzarotensis TaxID=1245769 RepID=A0A0C7N1N9_9SACH|nr:uncharacterized protein LALA0_S04e03026g [Lachancea lanzarotensis]CEP61891.1 LALA0S04e03026g1_1 [Lachancea lanzarotensis]